MNIDYEKIYEDMANDYIEFIRELSIECRKNNIVLSVDTYVSQAYNQFYNRKGISEVADYLVIMGYDEHWAGDSEAGSVASLPYVQKGINEVIEYAPADRVINGIPFYTRIWTETKEGAGSEGTYVEDAVNGNYWLSSTAVSMERAQTELSSHGITPTWLEDLSQYYGEYETNTGSVRIWLEEEKSIQAEIRLHEKCRHRRGCLLEIRSGKGFCLDGDCRLCSHCKTVVIPKQLPEYTVLIFMKFPVWSGNWCNYEKPT